MIPSEYIKHELNQELIVQDYEKIQSYVGEIELLDSEDAESDAFYLKQMLWAYIVFSKDEIEGKKVEVGAANAITILNHARVSFSGMNLRKIQVRGAKLNQAIFDNAQLQDADLRYTSLDYAWLRKAKFSGANMEGVHFGEAFFLQFKTTVTDFCYSPDSRLFAVSCSDKIYIYEANTNKLKRIFEMEGFINFGENETFKSEDDLQKNSHIIDMEVVNSIAFSPDSRYLISGGDDPTVRLWEIETNVVKGFAADNKINSVAFSPNGEWIAAGGKNGDISVWSVKTEQKYCVLGKNQPLGDKLKDKLESRNMPRSYRSVSNYGKISVVNIVFSPDSKNLAAVYSVLRGNVSIWNVSNKSREHLLGIYADTLVGSLAYSSDGKFFAVGFANYVTIWIVGEEYKRYFTLEAPGRLVNHLSFSHDGHYIAAGNEAGLIFLWEISSKRLIHQFAESNAITCISFNHLDDFLMIGNKIGEIKLLSLTSKSINNIIEGEGPVYTVAASSHNKLIVSGGLSKNITLRNLTTGKVVRELYKGWRSGEVSSWCVTFSSSGKLVATNVAFGIHIWDTDTGKAAFKIALNVEDEKIDSKILHDHKDIEWGTGFSHSLCNRIYKSWNDTNTIAFSPNEQCVAIAGRSATIYIWHLISEQLMTCLKGHAGAINCIAFHPYANFIISASDDKTIKFWSTKTNQLVATYTGHFGKVLSVVFSPDGQQIISGSEDRTIILWDIDGQPQHIFRGHQAAVRSIAFSPNGKMIASGCNDNNIIIWDVCSRKHLAVLPRVSGNNLSVCWAESNSESYLISSSDDKAIRCWCVKTNNDVLDIQLYWTSCQPALVALDAQFTNVVGLDIYQHKLLKKYGAEVDAHEDEILQDVMDAQKSKLTASIKLIEAAKLIGKAKNGDSTSQFILGSDLILGCEYGIEEDIIFSCGEKKFTDYSAGIKWLAKAAEQGHAKAHGLLGFCYEDGRVVLQDQRIAINWYTKGAVLGDISSLLKLGLCYIRGDGVVKNEEIGFNYVQEAAKKGFIPALKVMQDAWLRRSQNINENVNNESKIKIGIFKNQAIRSLPENNSKHVEEPKYQCKIS